MSYRLFDDPVCNEIVCEMMYDVRAYVPSAKKVRYMSVAEEAFGNKPGVAAAFGNKLTLVLNRMEEIDYGVIDNSRGNLAKYKYYRAMVDAMNFINENIGDKGTENTSTMNKLHKILLQITPDFMYGYAKGNIVLTSTYKNLVMALHELINISIVDLAKVLRKNTDLTNLRIRAEGNLSDVITVRRITKNTIKFIKFYESGQWGIMVNYYRKDSNAQKYFLVTPTLDAYNDFSDDVDWEAVLEGEGSFSEAKNVFSGVADFFANIPQSSKIIGIVIALLVILRTYVFYFLYFGIGRIREYLHINQQIVKASILQEEEEKKSRPGAIEKQQKAYNKISALADTIDYRIVKNEVDTEKKIGADNRTLANVDLSRIDGTEFEI